MSATKTTDLKLIEEAARYLDQLEEAARAAYQETCLQRWQAHQFCPWEDASPQLRRVFRQCRGPAHPMCAQAATILRIYKERSAA